MQLKKLQREKKISAKFQRNSDKTSKKLKKSFKEISTMFQRNLNNNSKKILTELQRNLKKVSKKLQFQQLFKPPNLKIINSKYGGCSFTIVFEV